MCDNLMKSISQKVLEDQNKHTSRYSEVFQFFIIPVKRLMSCITRTCLIPNKLVMRTRESESGQVLHLCNIPHKSLRKEE